MEGSSGSPTMSRFPSAAYYGRYSRLFSSFITGHVLPYAGG
jgi:hypothetical protein